MGLYYIPRDDYLMHHGVKGQKWGVRNDPERVGRRRSGLTTANDVNQKRGLTKGQKTALKVGAGVAAAGLAIGAGVALHKSGMGKQVVSAGMKMLKPATKVKIANTAWKHSAKESGKVFKAAIRKERAQKAKIYAQATARVAKKYAKVGAQKTGNAMKKIAKETSGGVFDALKGLAGTGEDGFFSRSNIKQIVVNGGKKGLNTLSTAAISGGVVLGAKSLIRGQGPSRQEAAKWLTRNPNDQ